MTRVLKLLGDPVAHSRSPAFQNAGLRALDIDATYGVQRVDAEGLADAADAVRTGRWWGANVTVPHKALALALADVVTERASLVGAANTWWAEAGRLHADNTDVEGVAATLDALGPSNGRLVVLGAGGAAAAAAVAGRTRGQDVWIVNRTAARGRELARRTGARFVPWSADAARPVFAGAGCVVHATAVQRLGEARADAAFDMLPWDSLPANAALFDLDYGEAPGPFLRRAAGRPRTDGAWMLLIQGVAAFERWVGRPAPVEVMQRALAAAVGRSPDGLRPGPAAG